MSFFGSHMYKTALASSIKALAMMSFVSFFTLPHALAQKSPAGIETKLALDSRVSPSEFSLNETFNSPALLDIEQYQTSPYQSLSSTLDQALVPLSSQIISSPALDLDFSDTVCLPDGDLCGHDGDVLGLDYSTAILADKAGGVDFQFIPRAALNFGDEHKSALVGAIVKIGEDLRELDPSDNKRWYLFAGADAEALTFRTDNPQHISRGEFNLQDKIIVGDAQAGFGYQIGDADISLAYMRRDVNSYGRDDSAVSYTEDAAALSLTWRR